MPLWAGEVAPPVSTCCTCETYKHEYEERREGKDGGRGKLGSMIKPHIAPITEFSTQVVFLNLKKKINLFPDNLRTFV